MSLPPILSCCPGSPTPTASTTCSATCRGPSRPGACRAPTAGWPLRCRTGTGDVSKSRTGPLRDVPLEPAPASLIDGLIYTRALRLYTDEPIPDRVLRDILFVATQAPSGANRQ